MYLLNFWNNINVVSFILLFFKIKHYNYCHALKKKEKNFLKQKFNEVKSKFFLCVKKIILFTILTLECLFNFICYFRINFFKIIFILINFLR